MLAIGNLFQSFAEGFTAPMVDGKFSVKEAPLILGQSAVRTVESHSMSNEMEVSIVIPCLNEAETVGICVEKALGWIRDQGIHGEVILADNGSTDGSREIAQSKGARVIEIPNKRTLRVFLMFSPRWLFLIPGIVLMAIGLIVFGLLLPATLFVGQMGLDIPTLLSASFLIVAGVNSIAFALLTRGLANSIGFLPSKPIVNQPSAGKMTALDFRRF